MMGRLLAGGTVLIAAIAGALMYYLQVFAYYGAVDPADLQAVRLTSLISGEAEEIVWDNLEAVAGDNNPIRYRACFRTSLALATLTETYEIYDAAEPLIGPAWFDCFDAEEIGAALENGGAIAFLGESNPEYGVDRVVAILTDGRGFVWHQLNACGEAVFHGDPVPENCPPAPERTQDNG